MIQRRYRSKHESDLVGKKITLPDTVKAMKFIHGARAKYEQEPNKLSNIVNYALLVHCVDLDFSKALPIYEKALEQSPNHPLISRAYGIVLLASRQTPPAATFQTACRLFQGANVVDPTQAKFQSAAEIYFRWAVLVNPRNPLALLNYALLHQCIYRTFDKAEKLYRAALSVDPTNNLVSENYLLFTDERYLGGAYGNH
jgi:tetratricopeptide (TPR) repeat protein